MKLLKLCALGLMLGVFSLSSAYAADFTADKHLAAGMKCESCHGPDKKIETPDMNQCVKCHDPKKLAEKTKNVKPTNPHDSPHYHQNLECTLCHVGHEKSEIYCNQCHKFNFKMP